MQPLAEPAPASTLQLQTLTRISLFAALTGAGAFIHIPLGPAHISLQTMMVMLTGFVLGEKKATLAMFAYIGCGFIGLPMFGRGKSGPASFLGPTVGYIFGFVAAAAIAGLSQHFHGSKRRRITAMVVFGTLGTITLLLLGAVGMRLTLVDDWNRAFILGFYPFIIGDTIKMFAAIAIREAFFPGAENRNA